MKIPYNTINRCTIAALASAGIFAQTMKLHSNDDVYSKEANAFLSNLPAKLQENQTKAIRMALSGNSEQLEAIRSSRNIAPELPIGVTRTHVSDNLALFRDVRYDNDTLPLLVYLHGGGWTIGSINSCSRFCAALALNGIAVLAVDYRLNMDIQTV